MEDWVSDRWMAMGCKIVVLIDSCAVSEVLWVVSSVDI